MLMLGCEWKVVVKLKLQLNYAQVLTVPFTLLLSLKRHCLLTLVYVMSDVIADVSSVRRDHFCNLLSVLLQHSKWNSRRIASH